MKLYRETREFGVIASVLGAFAMIAWLVPIMGLIVSLSAIASGNYAFNSSEDGFAIAGITLGILALILTILRSGLVYFYG